MLISAARARVAAASQQLPIVRIRRSLSRNALKILSAVRSCFLLRARKSSTGRGSAERTVVSPRPAT